MTITCCNPDCPGHDRQPLTPLLSVEVPATPGLVAAEAARDRAQKAFDDAHAEWSGLELAFRSARDRLAAEFKDRGGLENAPKGRVRDEVGKPEQRAMQAKAIRDDRAREAVEARQRHAAEQHKATQAAIAAW